MQGRKASAIDRLTQKARRLVQSQDGVAAVEFAMIVPALLVAFLGAVEISQGLDADRKLSYVTSSIGDLVSQKQGTVTASTIESLFPLGDAMMRPYNGNDATLRVTIIDVAPDGSYTARVPVVKAGNAPNCPVASEALPQDVLDLARGRQLVVSEGCFGYTPLFGYVVPADIPLYKRAFNVPRAESTSYQIGQSNPNPPGNGSGGGGGGGGNEDDDGNNNCAGNSGGNGQGNNCNNPNQSHNNNGNGNGNGNNSNRSNR